MVDELRCGVYEHYKGKRYLVIGVAAHTETGELVAVYVPLYANDAPAAMAVRPLEMFRSTVAVDGASVPRFRFVGARGEVA